MAGGGDLPDLSALVPGRERRRHRRYRRHHPSPALRRQPRGRRDLDLAVLSLADARLRLRRDELPRRRPDVRHPHRLRRADRAGARARAAGDDRPRALPHLGPAPLVPREPDEPRQPQGQLVRVGRSQARRHAAQQLARDLRRLRLGVGQRADAVLPAQLPQGAARPQLPRSRGPGRAPRRRPFLARARRRRLPPRHHQLLLLRHGPPQQSGARRPSGATIRPRPRSTPTTGRSISSTRAGRR